MGGVLATIKGQNLLRAQTQHGQCHTAAIARRASVVQELRREVIEERRQALLLCAECIANGRARAARSISHETRAQGVKKNAQAVLKHG